MAHASSRTHHHSRDRLIRWARVYDSETGYSVGAESDSAPRWPMIFSCNLATGFSMWAVAPAAL